MCFVISVNWGHLIDILYKLPLKLLLSQWIRPYVQQQEKRIRLSYTSEAVGGLQSARKSIWDDNGVLYTMQKLQANASLCWFEAIRQTYYSFVSWWDIVKWRVVIISHSTSFDIL